jgi:hypothetical protein
MHECLICLETIQNGVLRSDCCGKYHSECLELWYLEKKMPICPICRKSCNGGGSVTIIIHTGRPSSPPLPPPYRICLGSIAIGSFTTGIALMILKLTAVI